MLSFGRSSTQLIPFKPVGLSIQPGTLIRPLGATSQSSTALHHNRITGFPRAAVQALSSDQPLKPSFFVWANQFLGNYNLKGFTSNGDYRKSVEVERRQTSGKLPTIVITHKNNGHTSQVLQGQWDPTSHRWALTSQ